MSDIKIDLAAQENAIDKIRKLLALSADPNAAPGESENAARMAAKLMAKFAIDESVVLSATGSEVKIRCGFAYAKHMNKGLKNAPTFSQFIAIGVGEYLGCVTSLTLDLSDMTEKFKFAGEVNDVRFAVWLTETLCAGALRAYLNADTQEGKVAFLNGFGAAIQHRLKEMIRYKREAEAEMKASDSTALVVLDQKVALVKEKFGETSKRQKKHKTGRDGWNAGKNHTIPTGALEASPKHKALK